MPVGRLLAQLVPRPNEQGLAATLLLQEVVPFCVPKSDQFWTLRCQLHLMPARKPLKAICCVVVRFLASWQEDLLAHGAPLPMLFCVELHPNSGVLIIANPQLIHYTILVTTRKTVSKFETVKEARLFTLSLQVFVGPWGICHRLPKSKFLLWYDCDSTPLRHLSKVLQRPWAYPCKDFERFNTNKNAHEVILLCTNYVQSKLTSMLPRVTCPQKPPVPNQRRAGPKSLKTHVLHFPPGARCCQIFFLRVTWASMAMASFLNHGKFSKAHPKTAEFCASKASIWTRLRKFSTRRYAFETAARFMGPSWDRVDFPTPIAAIAHKARSARWYALCGCISSILQFLMHVKVFAAETNIKWFLVPALNSNSESLVAWSSRSNCKIANCRLFARIDAGSPVVWAFKFLGCCYKVRTSWIWLLPYYSCC